MKLEEILKIARSSSHEDIFNHFQISVSYRDCYDAIRSVRNSEELYVITKLIMFTEYANGKIYLTYDILNSRWCNDNVLKLVCDYTDDSYTLSTFICEHSDDYELLNRILKFARVGTRHVVAECATNPNILNRLAKDEDHVVRSEAVRNENTPIEVIRELLKVETIPEVKFQCHLRLSSHSTEDTLDMLADDPLLVTHALYHNLCSPRTLHRVAISKKDQGLLDIILHNRNTSAETLEFAAEFGDHLVRSSIPYHLNVTQEIVEALASDVNPSVRASAACSKLISRETLMKLAADDNGEVRNGVSSNRNLDSDIIGELLSKKYSALMIHRIYLNRNIEKEVLDMVHMITGIPRPGE